MASTRSKSTRSGSTPLQPRTPPSKVLQQRITQTYCNLPSIPTLPSPSQILHLYLSHNNIVNLTGIQAFSSLISLNVSYNRIEAITELNRISDKKAVKRVRIRMNPLPFGYQDYAVNLLPMLELFEDQKIGGDREREQIQDDCHFVADQLVQFMIGVGLVKSLLQELKRKAQITRYVNSGQRKGSQTNTHFLLQQNISLEALYQLAQLYMSPQNHSLTLQSNHKSLSYCRKLIQTSQQLFDIHNPSQMLSQLQSKSYPETVQNTFEGILNSILLGFSSRNITTFKDSLQKLAETKSCSLVQAFGCYATHYFQPIEQDDKNNNNDNTLQPYIGGYKISESLISDPAKYLVKVDQHKLRKHPLIKYVTHPPFDQEIQSWTKWKYLEQQLEKDQEGQEEQAMQKRRMQCLFERVPIWAYEKNYMEVVLELVLTQVGHVLKLHNELEFMRKRKESQWGHENQRINENQKVNQNQSINQNVIAAKSQSPSSQAVIFKIKSIGNMPTTEIDYEKKECDCLPDDKLRKTLIKKSVPTYNNSINNSPRKTISHKGPSRQAYDSYKRYNLHELFLLFKVLRALKKRVTKKRNKQKQKQKQKENEKQTMNISRYAPTI